MIVAAILLLIGTLAAFRKRKQLKDIVMNTVKFIREKTWDIVTERRIALLHPLIRDKAREFINRAEKELGIKLRITSALRTWAEQESLYAKGRTMPGKVVTNAKPGQSLHNYGLAIDVVEIRNGKPVWTNPNWKKIGELGKRLGFAWGGDFKTITDLPHFEMRFGKTLSELKELYASGQRDGEYINLA